MTTEILHLKGRQPFHLETRERTNRLFLIAGLACCLIAPLVFKLAGSFLPPCLFRQWTGVSCLTCGLTRSVCAFTSGRVTDAFSAHWMGPPLYIWACLLFLKAIAEIVTNKSFQTRWTESIKRIGLWTGAALWLVFWAQRFIHEVSEAA